MRYIVHGKRVIHVMMTVEADSEEEAIQLASEGQYTHIDTEPGYDYNVSRWTAEPQA